MPSERGIGRRVCYGRTERYGGAEACNSHNLIETLLKVAVPVVPGILLARHERMQLA